MVRPDPPVPAADCAEPVLEDVESEAVLVALGLEVARRGGVVLGLELNLEAVDGGVPVPATLRFTRTSTAGASGTA